MYLGNSFSPAMLDLSSPHSASFESVSASDVTSAMKAGARSIVGFENTANVLSSLLGHPIPYNRETIKLEDGDVLYVAQYDGPRLPEGATSLPSGASFTFIRVSIRRIDPNQI